MTGKLNNRRITNRQLLFSIACFLQASTLITAFFSKITLADSWMIVIAGTAVALLLVLLYSKLVDRFPDKTLVEMAVSAFGPVGGKIAGAVFLIYIFNLMAFNLRDVLNFLNNFILPNTPSYAILIPMMAVCGYAVYKGIEIIFRYGISFVLIAALIIVTSVLLLLGKMDFGNFLPILDKEPIKYVQSLNIIMMAPFGEIMIFLMVTPNVKNKKKMFKTISGGVLLGALSLLVVIVRDTAVLGDGIRFTEVPAFDTLRTISAASGSLNRMETLYAIALMVLLFFKLAVLYYCLTVCIEKLFSLSRHKLLIIPVGALVAVYSSIVFRSTIDTQLYGAGTAPIVHVFVQYVIPLAMLVVAAIRSKRDPPEQAQEQEDAPPGKSGVEKAPCTEGVTGDSPGRKEWRPW